MVNPKFEPLFINWVLNLLANPSPQHQLPPHPLFIYTEEVTTTIFWETLLTSRLQNF